MTEPKRYTFKTLYFEATRRCNFACDMCMTASNDKEVVKNSLQRELSTEEIVERVFKPVKDIGVGAIIWSGGEFILRPDSTELIRLANEYGFESTVCSNGAKITREKLLELNDASGGTIVIAAGINSITEDNKKTRDADYDIAMRTLDLCLELDIRRHVVVAIGQHNEDTIEETLQWLDDNAIPYNRSPYTARGSGRSMWGCMRLQKESMEKKIHPALRKHVNGYVSYTPFFLSPEVHEKYSQGESNVTVPQNPSIGCWCGTWLALNAEGDVSPCGILLDEYQCGNVRDKSFQEIIDQSDVFQQVLDRTQLKGKCGKCRYQFTCGGCRAMAHFEHNDIMAEDPTCFFEPEDSSTVCEHEKETNKNFQRYAFMMKHLDRTKQRGLKSK